MSEFMFGVARVEAEVARPWVVECDGEHETYRTRREAREAARRWRRHPANTDIRAHGPYRNATGRVRVLHENELQAEREYREARGEWRS